MDAMMQFYASTGDLQRGIKSGSTAVEILMDLGDKVRGQSGAVLHPTDGLLQGHLTVPLLDKLAMLFIQAEQHADAIGVLEQCTTLIEGLVDSGVREAVRCHAKGH